MAIRLSFKVRSEGAKNSHFVSYLSQNAVLKRKIGQIKSFAGGKLHLMVDTCCSLDFS